MAIGSIIYLDSNVYGYAASGGGDAHQLRLAAEAQSLLGFVRLGMLRLVHSGLVDREIVGFRNELVRKRIERVVPQPRHVYRTMFNFDDLLEPAIVLAKRISLDEADALHALIAASMGAEYIVSAEESNFVAKLHAFAVEQPKAYENELGALRAVSLLQWHAEIIGHG